MKKPLMFLFSLLVMLSMLLGACGGTQSPAVEEPAAVETQAVDEPAAEPVASVDEMLDAGYTTFLADMVAYNTISLESLNELLAEEPPPFLLDVRSASEVEEKGRIEGSVVVPLRELAQHLDQLPSFDTTIVSYCGSGWRCTIAMTALEALGWQDVLSLKGGSFGGWLDAGYPVVTGMPEPVVLNAASPNPELVASVDATLSAIPEGWGVITAEALNTELAENPDLVLLDVRKASELDEKGYIEGAVNIPLEELIARKADWPAKDARIAIYCGSGHRSTIAMTILWTYGYSDVRSLKDGFGGWTGAGYPVVGGPVSFDAAYATFLADMVAYNTISLESLNEMLAEEPPPFLLDVRSASEVEEKGRIEGSVVIPLRELAQHLDQLPSFDTTIVSYCGSGWRCTIAMTALEALGWQEVLSLKGGSFGGWVAAGYPVVTGMPEPVVLNAASPDSAEVAAIDAMLTAIPEGWGVITAEALNTELAENPDLVLLDVRKASELEENGLIEGAINIPLEELIAMKADWPADKAATIVAYCGSGHRSTIAMTILWTYGYGDVRSLKDGFGGWVGAGYPVVDYAMAN